MGMGGNSNVTGGLSNRLQALAINGSNQSNQNMEDDAIVKFQEHEQEILQLRKLLSDYSVKESRMLSEKYLLEKRLALMRLAFDQQQQELVDAASKAISYRQDILEENIRLTYALETAQEERLTFVSALTPLLTEFSLHSPAANAQFIVGNVRVLLRHLQEKLMITEGKLRESHYQLQPWQSEMNLSNRNSATNTEEQHSERAISNVSPDLNDLSVQKNNDIHVNPPYLPPILEETSSLITEPDEEDGEDEDDEFDEDDNGYELLPAIEGLQILGEPFPGRELQASGYSTNGTTHCDFEWVRHLEDGSINYIDGANQPTYIVTADDVDTYLAIEVLPLDDKQRKGELVKCFANSNRKISCDPIMHHLLEKTLNTGQASYKLHLWIESQDKWEPATLEIKPEGYSIKTSRTRSVVLAEKFSSATVVNIQNESPVGFSIIGTAGIVRYLRTDSTTDVSCLRDTIVLTLRLFTKRSVERKKEKKKRVLFFTK